jgi:pilus assembly protein CpaF
MNLEVFLSYLDPIAGRFSDPEVNELRINANGTVYEERRGSISRIPELLINSVQVQYAAGNVAGETNAPFNERHPRLDARLEDGSRISIVGPPVSSGIAVTIRRFPTAFELPGLVTLGTLTSQQADWLTAAVLERKTILISGSTRAGKTTFARVLLNLIPVPGDRLVLIEQPSELNLRERDTRDILEMECRDPNEYTEAFTARDAVKAALRHSPDRIIVGETRGGEAFDFIDALNTGHSGSLTTVHANSASDALARIVTLVKRGDVSLPYDVIVDMVSRSIDLVVHLDRSQGRRVVAEIVRVTGVSDDRRRILIELMF